MDLTTRSQQAVSNAVREAAERGNPAVEPVHLAGALLADEQGLARPMLQAVGIDPSRLATELATLVKQLPAASGSTVSAPQTSRGMLSVLSAAERIAKDAGDEYVSVEHLLLALAEVQSEVSSLLHRLGATSDALRAALEPGARLGPGDQPGSGRQLPGAGEVRRGSDRRRPGGQAGPGDRPGRRDPAGRPGAVAPDQEQPGADRRTGRGQDRRRRGPGPADRGRRRTGITGRQAADRPRPGRDGGRREVPRRVRGAVEGRAHRDQGLRRSGRHLHRRAAHRGGCRRDRRGRHGRRQHAQADAGAR